LGPDPPVVSGNFSLNRSRHVNAPPRSRAESEDLLGVEAVT
jgi:hypothetical protein